MASQRHAVDLVLNVSGLDKNDIFIKSASIFRGHGGGRAMETGTRRLAVRRER